MRWRVEKIELHEEGPDGPGEIAIVAEDGEVIANNQTYYPQALNPKWAPLIAAAPALLDLVEVLWYGYEPHDAGEEKTWEEAKAMLMELGRVKR